MDAFGVEAVAPMVYRARIDLRPRSLAALGGGKGVEECLISLRNLRNGSAVTIVAPGTETGFTGYVLGLDEQLAGDEEGEGVGYLVNVLLERYDWDGASAG
mgnify:CR=1 FL=1